MATVQEIHDYLDTLYPPALRCEWDNDGLMVTQDPDSAADRVLCALDVTDDVIDEAKRLGCHMIVSHHPLIFRPLSSVNPDCPVSRMVIRLLRERISVCSFHTRFDAAPGGMNDLLAQKLELTEVIPFGAPGEEMGRIGMLSQPMDILSFIGTVKRILHCEAVRAVTPVRTVSKVAILGGVGKSFYQYAMQAGAQVYLTGEMSHDTMLTAEDLGLDVIAAGHGETERICAGEFARVIAEAFPEVDTFVSGVSSPIRTL